MAGWEQRYESWIELSRRDAYLYPFDILSVQGQDLLIDDCFNPYKVSQQPMIVAYNIDRNFLPDVNLLSWRGAPNLSEFEES